MHIIGHNLFVCDMETGLHTYVESRLSQLKIHEAISHGFDILVIQKACHQQQHTTLNNNLDSLKLSDQSKAIYNVC